MQLLPAAQRPVAILEPVYVLAEASTGPGDLAIRLEATSGVPVAATTIAASLDGTSVVLAVGQPSREGLAFLQTLVADASARSDAAAMQSTSESAPDSVGALAVWRSTHGFFSTFWTDPVGLTVNSVIDEAHWQYNGSKVRSLTGNDSRTWLTANGWREVSHSIGSYYNAASTVGTVYTNDHFRTTSWFPCPNAGAHDTWYQANNVYGFADGHVGGGVNTWATGTCKGLLSVTAFASPGS
jgi:hypothetical protein